MVIRRYASGVTIDQILHKHCYNVPIINRLTLTRCLDVDLRTKQLFATDVQYSSWWEGKYINNEDYLRIKCLLIMFCFYFNNNILFGEAFSSSIFCTIQSVNAVYFIVHTNFVALACGRKSIFLSTHHLNFRKRKNLSFLHFCYPDTLTFDFGRKNKI